ncbi:MAG: hypothetical protein ACRCSK_00860 [Fusobacteriaceae bacterium]
MMVKKAKLILGEEAKKNLEALGLKDKYYDERTVPVGFNVLAFFFPAVMAFIEKMWVHLFVILAFVGIDIAIIDETMDDVYDSYYFYYDHYNNYNYYYFIEGLVILIVLVLAVNIFYGFMFNKLSAKKLLSVGYVPATPEDRKVLLEGKILKR